MFILRNCCSMCERVRAMPKIFIPVKKTSVSVTCRHWVAIDSQPTAPPRPPCQNVLARKNRSYHTVVLNIPTIPPFIL
jgi:hypothetical protein